MRSPTYSPATSDPATGESYGDLPWDLVPVAALEDDPRAVEVAALLHSAIVAETPQSGSVTHRLTGLASSLVKHLPSLQAAHRQILVSDWVSGAADLIAAGPEAAETWLRVHEDATADRWPRTAPWFVNAYVNAVIRGPRTETLHADAASTGGGTPPLGDDFFTFLLNWAAGSVLSGMDLGDLISAKSPKVNPRRAGVKDAASLPGWVWLEAVRSCADQNTNWTSVDLAREPVSQEPVSQEPASPQLYSPGPVSGGVDRTEHVRTLRHGWTAPDSLLWAEMLSVPVVFLPTLFDISRQPVALVTAISELLAAGVTVVTPNTLFSPGGVSRRLPPIAAPSSGLRHPRHLRSQRAWRNSVGVGPVHAELLAERT